MRVPGYQAMRLFEFADRFELGQRVVLALLMPCRLTTIVRFRAERVTGVANSVVEYQRDATCSPVAFPMEPGSSQLTPSRRTEPFGVVLVSARWTKYFEPGARHRVRKQVSFGILHGPSDEAMPCRKRPRRLFPRGRTLL
jgi:hypothetical protein